MHAVIAFALGPIGRYVVLAGLALAAVFYAIHTIEQRQDALTRAKIEAAQKEKADAAKSELDRLIGGDDSRVRQFDR